MCNISSDTRNIEMHLRNVDKTSLRYSRLIPSKLVILRISCSQRQVSCSHSDLIAFGIELVAFHERLVALSHLLDVPIRNPV